MHQCCLFKFPFDFEFSLFKPLLISKGTFVSCNVLFSMIFKSGNFFNVR